LKSLSKSLLTVVAIILAVFAAAWFLGLQIRVTEDRRFDAVVEQLPPSQSDGRGRLVWMAYVRTPEGQRIVLNLPAEHNCVVGSKIVVVRSETMGGWRYQAEPEGCRPAC
jgi:hypothetical protein